MIPTNVPIKADFVFPSWRFHEVKHKIRPISGIKKLTNR